MPGLFLSAAACALSLLDTGCPSLTLTLPSRKTFLFSLLFVFGLASANIWYQMLLTEKRKNYAVLVGQQQLYQKMV